MHCQEKSNSQHWQHHRRPKRTTADMSGFTLIEIVISIGIMAILITVAYSALTALGRSQAELKEQRDLQITAFSIMNRLTREIRLATKQAKSTDPENQFYLKAEDETLDQYPGDKLTFMASGAGQQLSDGFFNPGIIQITYELKQDPDDPQNPWRSLIRDEVPNKKPYEDALKERVTFPLYSRVAGLDFQFFESSSDAWRTNWQDPNNIPDLVQINLYLVSISDKVHTYTTTVKLSG
jgi:type II secretion system protein J